MKRLAGDFGLALFMAVVGYAVFGWVAR